MLHKADSVSQHATSHTMSQKTCTTLCPEKSNPLDIVQ